MSFIRILFTGSCPSTILRAIVSTIVNSINGSFIGRTLSHIFKKSSERFSPSFAHPYSPCPIVFESWRSFAITPNLNRRPRSIFLRLRHSMLNSHFMKMVHPFFMKASATFYFPRCKRVNRDYFASSTGTITSPKRASKPIFPNNDRGFQSSEYSSSNIFEPRTHAIQDYLKRLLFVNILYS